MQADNDPKEPAEASENLDNPAAENPEPDPWEELEADVAKWKELSLRTAAEMDNQRLLEELLPVIDNFEMGMQAASQDTSSMIYIGMDMVRRQLNEFLAAQGVEEIATDGLFDPNLHEAVAQEDCAKGDEGRILRVTRKGYKLRDRLLRPASVVVSKLPTEAPAEGGDA